jgi:hypothetical protein
LSSLCFGVPVSLEVQELSQLPMYPPPETVER